VTFAVVFSGAAGLIFQIVWLYECSLVFGNSLWSATIVLSSFMAGLALGNALVARAARRITRPLAVYAALEVAVAVSGVALTYGLPHLGSILSPLLVVAGSHIAAMNALRLAVAIAVLVVPATAMGATLPVVVGAMAEGRTLGRVLGHLYGWNTFGAVAGVVLAEFVFVRYLGVTGSGWVAAACDVVAAATAWKLGAALTIAAPPQEKPRIELRGGRHVWSLLVAAFLAGAVLLALEVVWFRFLTMYVLSTTMTVSVMLAVVLAAIGAGGLAASALMKSRPGAAAYVTPLALLAGCVTVGTYAAFGTTTSGTQIAQWQRVLWMACALAAPTSLASGALFTLLGHEIERIRPGATRATAALTLANTAGAAMGAPLATFVLLPVMGMEGALFALALSYLGVATFAYRPRGRQTPALRTAALAVACFVFLVALVQFPFGAMRDRYFPRSAAAYADDGSTIVATREGASNTVFLMQQSWLGKPVYDRLVTDGFSMSGTAVQGLRYMRAFAYWPLLLHRAPLKRALVVCYGVGATAQAVDDIATLDSIDVVEISRDVVAMSDTIYEGERAPLSDPRVRLHIEDGRSFLQSSADRFDLITGEPPPPRTPGTVNIYTREYFQLIRDHLAEGGVTTYWLPVARPHPGTDVDTILRAFCDVFHDCSLWNATPFDLMLVGTRDASGPVDKEAFSKPWITPGLQAHLREVGFEEPEEIGATFLGDAEYIREITKDTPPLVDDFPQRLVPSPSRPSLSDPRYATEQSVADYFQKVIDPARAQALFASSPFVRRYWPDSLRVRSIPAFEYQRIINRVFWEGGKPLRQIEDLHFLLTKTQLRTLPLWMLGSDEAKERAAESTGDDRTGAVEYARGLRALTIRGYAAAEGFLTEADRHGFGGVQTKALRAYAAWMAGDVDRARAITQESKPTDADEAHFWEWIRTHIVSGASAS
jgi:spermidine synthase